LGLVSVTASIQEQDYLWAMEWAPPALALPEI
jgi:hypothetical protein